MGPDKLKLVVKSFYIEYIPQSPPDGAILGIGQNIK